MDKQTFKTVVMIHVATSFFNHIQFLLGLAVFPVGPSSDIAT